MEGPIIDTNAMPEGKPQPDTSIDDAQDGQSADCVVRAPIARDLPPQLVQWIEGLSSERKQSYAKSYARAVLEGSSPPAVPSFGRKDWPERTRRRIDRTLSNLDRATVVTETPNTSVVPLGDPVSGKSTPPSTIDQLSQLGASLDLVLRWWTVTNQEITSSLRNILDTDRARLPADVAAAVADLDAFVFSAAPMQSTPTDVVNDLLTLFDERELMVMRSRLWSNQPDTLDAIATRVGVTRERIRQIQSKATAELVRTVASAAFRPVAWYAQEIRTALGPYLPFDVAVEHLAQLEVTVPSETADVLLYLAGSYKLRSDNWLEATDSKGASLAASAVADAFGSTTIATTELLLTTLANAGMSPAIAKVYLYQKSGLRRWDESWVIWRGTAVDKAFRVLELIGEPASAESINDIIGEGHSVGTVKNGMSRDPRFLRTGKRTWGLSDWRVEEYSGIAEEILERIDARGGAVDVEDLVRELVQTFPDISETSVRMYLTTPAVFIEGQMVRRREEADGWLISQTLREARGVFRTGHNELRLVIPVTRDVLRGSGQSINPAFSAALRVIPGHHRTFTTSDGVPLTVKWRPWSTSGPDIGSVRVLRAVADADVGDTVVLIFGLENDSLDAVSIRAQTEGSRTLEAILGSRSGEDLAAMAAQSIGCRASEVRSVLRERGDGDLADVIPGTTDSRLDNEIQSLIAQLS